VVKYFLNSHLGEVKVRPWNGLTSARRDRHTLLLISGILQWSG
jgi:hypothetical protein